MGVTEVWTLGTGIPSYLCMLLPGSLVPMWKQRPVAKSSGSLSLVTAECRVAYMSLWNHHWYKLTVFKTFFHPNQSWFCLFVLLLLVLAPHPAVQELLPALCLWVAPRNLRDMKTMQFGANPISNRQRPKDSAEQCLWTNSSLNTVFMLSWGRLWSPCGLWI